ncbi:MAG TPA: CRISPR-associated helicase Cas3', partial [Anaerolineae bacterium]|nr:CRISPR-associated helicase Cas3' [Anaerolineae bacterium]
MPQVDQDTKRKRVELVYHLVERHDGLTEQEIADMLNMGRRSVNNYLNELQIQGRVDKVEGRLWIALPFRRTRLRHFELSPEEAMTLYLATRLLVKQHDKRNESAEAALVKLAEVLTGDVGVGYEIHQAAQELAQRPGDVSYSRVFRAIMQSYIYRHRVSITYHPMNRDPFQTVLSPYLLEPSAIGYATYVIGHSSIVDDLRTYKLQRIEQATLTGEEYIVPPDFPGLEYLRSAWSIISGEDLIDVRLRFSPRVTRRVRESRWHPSQDVTDDPETPGGCIWTAQVADLTDFRPWVRSWGADVEVLAPERLRKDMVRETRRIAKLYDVIVSRSAPEIERLLRCWGKTGDNAYDFHPALFHMIDVGHVAQTLLQSPASPRWRSVLAVALGVELESLSSWLPYAIAMHDIGKISAAFQGMKDDQQERLKAEGFTFKPWRRSLDLHHTQIGQVFIQHELSKVTLPDRLQQMWVDVIGGHHGQFRPPGSIKPMHVRLQRNEPLQWRELRSVAAQVMQEHFLGTSAPVWPEPHNLSTATMALTGFTILCDWLGSDERFFPQSPDLSLEEYARESYARAECAVKEAGFHQRSQSTAPTAFAALFPDKQPARPLQAAVDAIPQDVLAEPCLAIIEAPTGEGKTEAALALAHRLASSHDTDELYYALPTTATSNQMFGRLQEHLRDRLGVPTDVKLIHGQAFLMEDDLRIAPLDGGERADQDAMVEWFTSKKRAILAPFGVGTVDQAELAALNVKHNALRLIGLAGKVVIFDEVHAYDTYMTAIVETLLHWLSALGTSVIILSATLPQAQRAALARAYGAELAVSSEQAQAYPSLWVFSRTQPPHHATPLAHQPNRRLGIHALHLTDGASKARWLLDAVADGGCACWITNTVNRAQQLFAALTDADSSDMDLMLLHARFPLEDRQALERKLTGKYGPNGDRPKRGIVVGTQVLEQSLDLDFDLMVSDIAPVDLLLQRAGRLQRHDRPRPAAFAGRPVLWINTELSPDGDLDLGVDRWIYDAFLLRQTWRTLQGHGEIHLLRECHTLVEAVYGITEVPPDSPLAEAWDNLQRKRSDAIKE